MKWYNLINWKKFWIICGIFFSSLIIGKLGASYEGCLFLYNPNRWLLGFTLLIPIYLMWLIKDDLFIKNTSNVQSPPKKINKFKGGKE